MSFSDKPKPLGNIVGDWFRQQGLSIKLDESNAIAEWAHLAGPQINGVTSSVWVKNQVLFVQITSATWRQELYLARKQWCQKLNDRLGKPVIKEIQFR